MAITVSTTDYELQALFKVHEILVELGSDQARARLLMYFANKLGLAEYKMESPYKTESP